MSCGVTTRLQNTDTAENSASASSAPFATAGVLEGTETVECGRRLSDQCEHRHAAGERLAQPRHCVQAPAARGRGHDAEACAAAAVAVGHGGGGEFVFGQHRGDVVTEERGVVDVFDIGTVDTEDEVNTTGREGIRRYGQPPDAYWPCFTCFRSLTQ